LTTLPTIIQDLITSKGDPIDTAIQPAKNEHTKYSPKFSYLKSPDDKKNDLN
jgi:hypothetical protein